MSSSADIDQVGVSKWKHRSPVLSGEQHSTGTVVSAYLTICSGLESKNEILIT